MAVASRSSCVIHSETMTPSLAISTSAAFGTPGRRGIAGDLGELGLDAASPSSRRRGAAEHLGEIQRAHADAARFEQLLAVAHRVERVRPRADRAQPRPPQPRDDAADADEVGRARAETRRWSGRDRVALGQRERDAVLPQVVADRDLAAEGVAAPLRRSAGSDRRGRPAPAPARSSAASRSVSATPFSSPKLGRQTSTPSMRSRCFRNSSAHACACCHVSTAPSLVSCSSSITGSMFERLKQRHEVATRFGHQLVGEEVAIADDHRQCLRRHGSSYFRAKMPNCSAFASVHQLAIDGLLLRLARRSRRDQSMRLIDRHAGDGGRRLQHGRAHLFRLDRRHGVRAAVEPDDDDLPEPGRLQRRHRAKRHRVVAGDDALDVPVALDHRFHLLKGLALIPVGALSAHHLRGPGTCRARRGSHDCEPRRSCPTRDRPARRSCQPRPSAGRTPRRRAWRPGSCWHDLRGCRAGTVDLPIDRMLGTPAAFALLTAAIEASAPALSRMIADTFRAIATSSNWSCLFASSSCELTRTSYPQRAGLFGRRRRFGLEEGVVVKTLPCGATPKTDVARVMASWWRP